MRMFSRTIPAEMLYPSMGYFEETTIDSSGKPRKHWIAIHKRGPLTLGWEVTYPTAYTLPEAAYDNIVGQFSQAIRHLPDWTVLHKQDVYLYDEYRPEKAEDFLARTYEKHFEGRRYLRHTSYLFLTLATEGLIMKKGAKSGLFGINSNVPVPKLERYEEFLGKCNEFIMTLTSSGLIRARELTLDDWQGTESTTGIVQRYMMLGNDSLTTSDVGFSAESISVYDHYAQCFDICESEQCPTQISNITRIDRLSGQSNDIYLSTGAELGVLLEGEHIVNRPGPQAQEDEFRTLVDGQPPERGGDRRLPRRHVLVERDGRLYEP